MDPYLGEIMLFAGTFAPRGWADCNGQLLSIPQNSALFSILGTTYGGDGKQTFALPDLRGRVPIHTGDGPKLSPRTLGTMGGAETVALTAAQMPTHTHTVNASKERASGETPERSVPAGTPNAYLPPDKINTNMASQMIGEAGGNGAHENMPPFLTIRYVIAIVGVYPSRS